MTRDTWYELHALRRRCAGDPGAVLHLTRDAQDARAEAVRHERATGEGTYLVETVGKATNNAADQALAWSWDGDGKPTGDTVALLREWQARFVRRYR